MVTGPGDIIRSGGYTPLLLTDLPSEVLLDIFSRVAPDAISALMATSQGLCHTIRDPQFLRALCIQDFGVNPPLNIRCFDVYRNHCRGPHNAAAGLSGAQVLRGHTGAVTCGVLCSGNRYVSGSADGKLRVWNLETGESIRSIARERGSAPVNCVTLLSDATRIVSGHSNGMVTILNLRVFRSYFFPKGCKDAHRDAVNCVIPFPNGNGFITGSDDGTLQVWDPGDCALNVWDPDSGPAIKSVRKLKGHTASVQCAALLHGDRLVSGSSDCTLRTWNPNTGKFCKVFRGHTGPVNCVISLPGAKQFASGSDDRSIKIWNQKTETCKTLTGYIRPIGCLALLSKGDNHKLVTGSDTGLIKVWGLPVKRDEDRPFRCFQNKNTGLSAVAPCSNGRDFVAGFDDGTLKAWSLETKDRQPTRVFTGHAGPVSCVTLLSDGKSFISASEDGTLRVWDDATDHQVLFRQIMQSLEKDPTAEVQEEQREAMELFAKLAQIRPRACNEIYSILAQIQDPRGGGCPGIGKAAFHSENGSTSTPLERSTAIKEYLAKTVINEWIARHKECGAPPPVATTRLERKKKAAGKGKAARKV